MKRLFSVMTTMLPAAAGMAQSPAWTRNEFPPVKGQYEYRVAYGKNKDDAWQSLHLELCRQFCGATLDSKTTGHQALDQVSGKEENYQRTVFNLDCECDNKIYIVKVDEFTTASGWYYALYEVSHEGMFAPWFPPKDPKLAIEQEKIRTEQSKQLMTDKLIVEGCNVYSGNTLLKPSQVLSIMHGNDDAVIAYSAGLRQWKSHRSSQIGYGIAFGVSAALTIFGITMYATLDEDNNTGKFFGDIQYPLAIAGVAGGPAVLLITIFTAISGGNIDDGSSKIRQAVDMYNNSRSRRVSKVEWGFGVTQQGLLGFVIKF